MYNFVLQIIVLVSLGVVIVLMARALPRVSDAAAPSRGPNLFDRLMGKLPMAKIDAAINSFFAKLLRKSKVLLMKTDNFINHRLGKLSKKTGAAEKPGNPDDSGQQQVL
jgi:hypothetical protein